MAGFDPNIYLGNPNLPSTKAQYEYTSEMIKEIAKCKKDIAHFAENHFFITTIDEGKRKIELHRPQKRILKSLGKYNRVATCASRQTGKCCLGNTTITIRNKKTFEVEQITMEEFHKRLRR